MNRVEEKLKSGKCLIIAEVAQAHDGSLGTAHAFIDAVAKTNADAIKFQTHIAEAESTLDEPWRIKFSMQDELRYDYWKRMEFTPEQWVGLKEHAEEKNLLFLSSPFSNEAVDLLEKMGMEAWKIASGEINNLPMIEKILSTKKPVIISSGMSDLEELDTLVGLIKAENLPLAVLQCTTAYPTPPEKMGINVMQLFKERYNCYVGLSDHSGTIFPGLAGAALGMNILELHVALSKEMFGPDVVASVDTSELKTLVEGIRFIETMMATPVEKNEAVEQMKPMRKIFGKSVVASLPLTKGTIITKDLLAFKKPGTGIPVNEYQKLIGKILNKNVSYNHFFREEDFN